MRPDPAKYTYESNNSLRAYVFKFCSEEYMCSNKSTVMSGASMRDRFGFSSRALANPSVYIISFSSVRKPGLSHPDSKIIKKLGKKLDLLASDLRTLEKLRAKVDETNAKLKDKRILDAKASSDSFSRDFFERPKKGELDPGVRFEIRFLNLVLPGAL